MCVKKSLRQTEQRPNVPKLFGFKSYSSKTRHQNVGAERSYTLLSYMLLDLSVRCLSFQKKSKVGGLFIFNL